MTLTSRLAIAMVALVALAVSAVGWLSYRSVEQAVLPRVLDRIEAHAELVAFDLQSRVRGARSDVATFHADAAVRGMLRARSNGGTDPVDHVSESTWRDRLLTRLAADLEAKPAYAQFRFIGADEGRELIRVDRSGQNGTVRIVPDAELQQKGDRPYFKDTIKLTAGEIYVSPIELNMENGVIETPHVPTLRVATPVFAPDGKPFGIVIVNLDMRAAFDRVRSSVRPGQTIYVVDRRGDYLVHPDRVREFGAQLGAATRWQSDFPALASAPAGAQGLMLTVPDAAGRLDGVAIASTVLAGNEWVGVIEAVPNAAFMASAAAVQHSSVLVGVIAVAGAAGLAMLVARSLTQPILQLTGAVEAGGSNAGIAFPVDARGETGVLARAFARAMSEAHSKTAALEREVAESKQTRQALGQQIEERRRIFETSQDLILVTDRKGVLVQVSPSAEAILGYSPEEMVGHSAIEFIDGDDLDNTRAEMRAARRRQRSRSFDSRYTHKDGRIVTLSWTGTWSEPVKRHFFIGRDMTESRLAQETLLESEQMARGIIATALDAFVQIDGSCRILNWNSQAEQIFGWPRQEALGKNCIELIIAGVEQDDLKAALQRFLDSGRDQILGRRREIMARRHDGREFRAELSVTALKRREGVVFNGFFRDLTEKIATEDRIRQAEKMEAVGQLTGGIAHDFNNILTVITGTIEILADAVQHEPQLAAITRMIDEAAARGAGLTHHLLAFARRQPLQPRETDVNSLIIDTVNLLRPTLGEQIEIETVFADETCLVTVDPNQLVTAVLNLALNARDAMPDGGKLILETGPAYLDEAYASLHGDLQPGRYALIAVSDTGTGIPAGMLDKVFEPFFTSKGPGRGTGLGLSMVYGFVKQSAGHIKIYSEQGHGTSIRMYLPPGTGTVTAEAASAPSAQGGHETILVVEDDRLVKDFVLTQLHSLGYVTLDAANGIEALGIVAAGHPFDLLFTDMTMPGAINGRQLANEIERSRPGLKVLFTSGYTENAIVHHGRLDSGVMLLAKPYRKSDMASMIRRTLAG